MFERSIIKHSGQMWKLGLAATTLALAGIGMVVSEMFVRSISTDQYVAAMMSSGVVALGSLAFACAAVRCPRCQAPWVWMAVSGQAHSAWLPWLMSLGQCPRCSVTLPVRP